MPRSSLLTGIALGLLLATGCSASSAGADIGSTNSGGNGTGGQGASGGSDNVGGFGVGGIEGQGGYIPTGSECVSQSNVDDDLDGFTEEEGDCNDCDPNVNPGAIEVIVTEPGEDGMVPPPADEDCDMQIDNVLPTCDDGIAIGATDPFLGAQAIDICQKATPADKKWGVLEAAYVRANGNLSPAPLVQQWGIKPSFGANVHPQGGTRMLALSSGRARDAGDAGACNGISCTSNYGGTAPPNFPQDVPGCLGGTDVHDDVALQLKLRAPKNATGYSFNFKFYSFEFPEWICTEYNDQFIALVNPPPAGSINGNISFDSLNNPVSVNIAFFDVCDQASKSQWAANCFIGSCPPEPNPYCPSGPAQLQGTGFDTWDTFGYGGGTSWLKTQAPVTGGQELTIRFAIWDTGDDAYDSTTLIDNFQWIATGGTVAVGTEPIPDPK